jgi:hypothetical protein
MFDNLYSIRFTKQRRQWRGESTGLAEKGKARSKRNLGVVLPHYSTI